ncbi:MAG: hypothetical protein WCY37_03840 [Candidatus Dojkabacteria bacterium]
MNEFIKQQFNRIFNSDYSEKELEFLQEKGASSEILVLKVLKDICENTHEVSYLDLYSVLSPEMLKELAEIPHVIRKV